MSKILMIVGHGKSKSGGYDSGAVSGNYQEFKIAREIAKYAYEYYNANFSEQCDLMNYDGDLYLQDRINKLQDKTYDFIAEIHLNAGGGTGTEVYYYHGSDNCKRYADAIANSISSAFSIRNRGAKTKLTEKGEDYFGIIRETKPTSVLVETMFIDTDDVEKINDESGQRLCGEAIAKGIWSVRNGKVDNVVPAPAPAPTPKPTPPSPPAPAKPSYYKGRKITLSKTKIYISSDAKTHAITRSGTFYIYDGKNYNSRYRICKKKEDCGKDIKYVVGYVKQSDIK